jgi:hypothetical protein
MKTTLFTVSISLLVTIVTGQNNGNFGNFGGTGMNMGRNSGPSFGTPQTFSTNANSMRMPSQMKD